MSLTLDEIKALPREERVKRLYAFMEEFNDIWDRYDLDHAIYHRSRRWSFLPRVFSWARRSRWPRIVPTPLLAVLAYDELFRTYPERSSWSWWHSAIPNYSKGVRVN